MNEEEEKNQTLIDNTPSKQLDQYEKVFAQNTEFFSTYNPDMIEEALISHLRDTMKIEPSKISKDKYKIKFQLVTKGQGDQEQKTEICVRILKVSDQQVAVEFTKVSGNQTEFHDHFRTYSTEVLAFANDTNLV